MLPTSPPSTLPDDPPPRRTLGDRVQAAFSTHRDVRSYLPPQLARFLGWRPPLATAPFAPLPLPPFSWLPLIPIQYEVYLLSLLGSFVSIALIEIVMSTAFADRDVPLIIASFGASAVLVYGAVDSPLAQPRHLLGGQVLGALVGVAVTRLFRHASAYELSETTVTGELRHVVWLNGALAMALSLLVMQVTKTVHPPAGATALIAAVMPSAVDLSWRYIYIVLISSLLMLGWALIINNVGRRRYPTYWLSGARVFVRDAHAGMRTVTRDDIMMGAEEGRNQGFDLLTSVMSRDPSEEERLAMQTHPRLSHSLSRTLTNSRSLSRSHSRSGSMTRAHSQDRSKELAQVKEMPSDTASRSASQQYEWNEKQVQDKHAAKETLSSQPSPVLPHPSPAQQSPPRGRRHELPPR